MTNKVQWRRWVDPIKVSKKDIPLDEDECPYEIARFREAFGIMTGSLLADKEPLGPTLVGPQGIIPLHESMEPSRLYNLWMGHTNFPLKKKHFRAIKTTLGVEGINVFSPYRFRIAIGLNFFADEVKESIVAALNPPPPAPRPSKVNGLIEFARKTSEAA